MLHLIVQSLNLFDFTSTAAHLYNGGAEANPVVVYFMTLLGTYGGLAFVKSVSALGILFLHLYAKPSVMKFLFMVFATLTAWHIYVWVG